MSDEFKPVIHHKIAGINVGIFPTPPFKLVKDNGYTFTIDVNNDVHQWILNEQPVCNWKYSNITADLITQTRIEVLKQLYTIICLKYS